MTKITSFNKDVCKKIRKIINDNLADAGAEHGLHIECGHISYRDTCLTAKVEISTVSEDGTVNTKEADSFLQLAESYGLKAEDLGRSIRFRGDSYKIVGAAPKSYKYPIIVKNGNREFKLTLDSVRRALGRDLPEACLGTVREIKSGPLLVEEAPPRL